MRINQDYEALIRELLAGVAGGWSYGNVIVLLMRKGIDEADLALWLTKFTEGSSLERDGELIEQIKLLGKMTPGKLAAEAFLVAAKFDRSYGEGSELLNHEAWCDRGVELYELGRYEEAIANYDRAIEINPDLSEAWNERGAILCDRLGQYAEAINSFDRAIEINPDYHDAWFNRGIALNNLEQYAEAIAGYDQAIAIKPDDHQAWTNRGGVLVYLERYEEVIASCDRAVLINPDDHKAWYNRGRAIGFIQGYQAKIEAYQEAFLQIHPDSHPEGWGFLHHEIGLTHYHKGKNQRYHLLAS